MKSNSESIPLEYITAPTKLKLTNLPDQPVRQNSAFNELSDGTEFEDDINANTT